MKIAVSVESTNDLSKELLQKNDIKVIPYEIVLGDRTFKDGEVSTLDMFKFVDENGVLPKTNAINEFEYTEYFTELRKEYDAVVHIALSSGLSSSCGNAVRASKNVENVYVVDSLSLSTGIGILALYARELADQGKDAEEIAKLVQERTEKIQCTFVIERLDYLHKGGKMSSDKKYKGNMVGVVGKYCAETLNEFNTPDLDKVFITYTTASPEMIESAEKAVKDAGFKNIYKMTAGGTIASHCGANTLGIIYFNDGEN